MHPTTHEALATRSHVLITVRDPIDRLFSSFAYDVRLSALLRITPVSEDATPVQCEVLTPRYCVAQHPREGVKTAINGGAQLRHFYECFPTAAALVGGITNASRCGELGRQLIAEPPPSLYAGSHMHMGLCFYIGGVLDALRRRRIRLIRTASCANDTAGALAWLGLKPRPIRHTNKPPTVRSTPNPVEVGSAGWRHLREFLDFEYSALHALERMNLSR